MPMTPELVGLDHLAAGYRRFTPAMDPLPPFPATLDGEVSVTVLGVLERTAILIREGARDDEREVARLDRLQVAANIPVGRYVPDIADDGRPGSPGGMIEVQRERRAIAAAEAAEQAPSKWTGRHVRKPLPQCDSSTRAGAGQGARHPHHEHDADTRAEMLRFLRHHRMLPAVLRLDGFPALAALLDCAAEGEEDQAP